MVKINFWKKISETKVGKIFVYLTSRSTWNFRKNRKNSKISTGKSDKLPNHPKPIFLDLRRPMWSIWAIYLPRMTISENILYLWSWGIFGGFSGSRIFCRFAKSWHRRGKTIFSREMIFHTIYFYKLVCLVPETVKFWFLGHIHGSNTFFNTLKSETSHFSMIFGLILRL